MLRRTGGAPPLRARPAAAPGRGPVTSPPCRARRGTSPPRRSCGAARDRRSRRCAAGTAWPGRRARTAAPAGGRRRTGRHAGAKSGPIRRARLLGRAGAELHPQAAVRCRRRARRGGGLGRHRRRGGGLRRGDGRRRPRFGAGCGADGAKAAPPAPAGVDARRLGFGRHRPPPAWPPVRARLRSRSARPGSARAARRGRSGRTLKGRGSGSISGTLRGPPTLPTPHT